MEWKYLDYVCLGIKMKCIPLWKGEWMERASERVRERTRDRERERKRDNFATSVLLRRIEVLVFVDLDAFPLSNEKF